MWLLNQLARHHERETAALLQVGEKLRRAQASALRGDGPEPLREANDAWRAAVSSVLKRAREILRTDWGPPGPGGAARRGHVARRRGGHEERGAAEAWRTDAGARAARIRGRPRGAQGTDRRSHGQSFAHRTPMKPLLIKCPSPRKRRREAVTALRSHERGATKAETGCEPSRTRSRCTRGASLADARARYASSRDRSGCAETSDGLSGGGRFCAEE